MNKRLSFLFFLLACLAGSSPVQALDTLFVKSSDVNTGMLKPGIHRYLVYFKNGKDSNRVNYQLWSREIGFTDHQGGKAISIKQEWEDNKNVVHKVTSISDRKTFKPLYHETWWKNRGSGSFDFLTRKATFMEKPLTQADTGRLSKAIFSGFNNALNQDYFLNWHLDLEVFSTLPYEDKRTFVINFYDPGTASAPQKVSYTVSGSAVLQGYNDQTVDCWLLTHSSAGNNETFWISKKTREVLKLEQEFNGRYRYKIKLGFSS